MPATQESIKYIVKIVLFLTRPCYFTVLIEIYLVIDLLQGHLKR